MTKGISGATAPGVGITLEISPVIEIEPQHDAFTRWWIENVGVLPTPEDVVDHRSNFYKRGLHKTEEQYVREFLADSLVSSSDFDEPFDLNREIRNAALAGVDISNSPDVMLLRELIDLGHERQWRRQATLRREDTRRLSVALSHAAEKRLRRKSCTRAKARSKVRRNSQPRDMLRDHRILKEMRRFFASRVARANDFAQA